VGVYHYEPLGHQLEPVNADAAAAGELLETARLATGMDRVPPVLITMTARSGRVSRKYEGLPYALALMDVGALIQTLYLVCTAMRLAPCAIGSVRADVAARAFGTDRGSSPAWVGSW
jgi:SagB-type dehydrogenase family enzyme